MSALGQATGISSRWSDMSIFSKLFLVLVGSSILIYAGYVVMRSPKED